MVLNAAALLSQAQHAVPCSAVCDKVQLGLVSSNHAQAGAKEQRRISYQVGANPLRAVFALARSDVGHLAWIANALNHRACMVSGRAHINGRSLVFSYQRTSFHCCRYDSHMANPLRLVVARTPIPQPVPFFLCCFYLRAVL